MPNNWWFFDRLDRDFWNASFLLEVRGEYDEETLRRALAALLDKHAVLRSRWLERDEQWRQEFRPRGAMPGWWSRVDLAGAGHRDASAAISHACEQAQRRLTIGDRLFEAVYFDLGPFRPARLFLNVHHLLMDAYSQGIVLRDLQAFCDAEGAPTRAGEPARTLDGMAELADYWQSQSASGRVAADLDYWRSLGWRELRPLSIRADDATRLQHVPGITATGLASMRKDAAFTRRLQALAAGPDGYGIEAMLIAAIALSVRDWTGARALLLNLTCHNRLAPPVGFDLRETVGWICDFVDFLVGVGTTTCPLEALRRVTEQRRALAGREQRYTLLRHVEPAEPARQFFDNVPRHQLELNYIPPEVDPIVFLKDDATPGLRPAPESVGQRQGRMHANAVPFAKVYVDPACELVWYWAYPLETFTDQTFSAFLQENLRHLEAIVEAATAARRMEVFN